VRIGGTGIRIFLPYDSSLKAEQTTMTPKPQTNFLESSSQLSFVGSGPLCLKSFLETSSDHLIGLGLVLALASGSVKRERPLRTLSGSHVQSHSVVQSDLFTKCLQYLSNSISLAVETFCTFIPAFQISRSHLIQHAHAGLRPTPPWPGYWPSRLLLSPFYNTVCTYKDCGT
jgi:hypothetical protein